MRIDDLLNSQALSNLSSPQDFRKEEQLRTASQQFEAMFLSMMLHQMRKGMMKSKLFKRDPGENIMMGLLDQEIAKVWASQNGVGLSDAIFEQLKDTAL